MTVRRQTSKLGGALASVAVCAVAALWGTQAAAQSQQPGGGRLGALSGTGSRLFDLELSGRAAYDSNVARGEDIVADIRHLHKDDYIYTPSVILDINLPVGRQAVFLVGTVGYDFYQYNKTLESSHVNLEAGAAGRVGPCSGTLTGDYSVRQSDLAVLPLVVTKNLETQDAIGAQVTCATRSGLGVFVSGQHSQIHNSANTGVVDSHTDSVSGGLSYSTRLLGTAQLFVAHSRIGYDSSAVLGILAPNSTDTSSVGVRLSRPIGKRLDGSADISYLNTHIDGPGTSNFSGFAGRGSLNYRVNPRLGLTLIYVRSVSPTIQSGFDYSIVSGFELDGRYRLSPRLSASAGATWNQTSYRGQRLFLPNLVTHDEDRGIFGALTLSVGKKASLSIDARQDVRNTNRPEFNYTAYRAGITAIKKF